jgi:hypothetical protein
MAIQNLWNSGSVERNAKTSGDAPRHEHRGIQSTVEIIPISNRLVWFLLIIYNI